MGDPTAKVCKWAYQKFINAMRYLPLWASHSDLIASLLSAREHNLAVVLALELVDLAKTSQELTMIQAVNIDDLRSILGVLERID